MQNLLRSFSLIFLLVSTSVEVERIFAQCNPPPAETCEEASVFCSLDQMNGFSCNNPSQTHSPLRPLCARCCPPGNKRTWWAFVCQGGNATITLNVGTCTTNGLFTGLVMGIFGDCECSDAEEIECIPGCIQPNQSKTYQLSNLKPCKIYYLWLDCCANNICDFTLSTSGGGGPPSLTPLGFINNIASGIIQPVCEGACNIPFQVKEQTGSCVDATYVWTLDGVEVGGNSNAISLDFPDQGDFVICVTAYIGNPMSGSVCAQEGPVCATVKVRPLPDRIGSRTICYEAANPGGFKWYSQTIFTSGVYTEHLTDINCCKYDSVVQFTVLPENLPTNVYYISCDSQPFVDKLGRRYFSCQDHLAISLPKSTFPYKCDDAIILTAINVDLSSQWLAKCAGGKVELSPNISIQKKCEIGETYQFDYKWYKKNDTIQKTISKDERLLVDTINEDYCLEVNVRVDLGTIFANCKKTFCDTIKEAEAKNTTENIKLAFCDSAIVNGQTYMQSTTFTQQLKNVFGCDSTIITDLNITKSNSTNLLLRSCDSAIVNGQTFLKSGNYTQILKNTSFCDSILNLDLTIAQSNKTYFVYNSCDSILVNGQKYVQSGMYKQLLMASNGCDSILNLDISILSSNQTEINQTDCDSVVFNGKTYKQSGDYTVYYTGSNGCDSIIELHVNIPNSNTSPLVLSRCDSVTINQTHYSQSGQYTQKLISTNGCDSILNIDLTIWSSSQMDFSQSACDSVLINNIIYKKSGVYQQKLQTAAGCDSILNIDLNITGSSSRDTIFRSCDSVIINGQTYTQTGIYTQKLTNSNQCDSILIIDFTRLSKSVTSVNYTSCDSVTVNNEVYKQSGNYTQTFVNANHCDSVLNLNLSIPKSNSTDFNYSSCDTAIINGQLYSQTGNYVQVIKNTALCDSTININLNIFNSSSINYIQKSCDSAKINGQIYKQSGNYTQYLKTAHHCDSFLNIQLILSMSNTSSLSQNVCDSIKINGTTYYTSGHYLQNLINVSGCDSALTLDLTIKPGNPSTLEAGRDTSVCDGEIIKLNGIFSGLANLLWYSKSGSFENPNSLLTNYYPGIIGDEYLYLQAADDCKQWLDSLAVHILPRQIVQVTGDTIVNPCNEISFTASGGKNYIWTPSSFIECLDPPCSKVKLKSTASIRFTITTDGPCSVPANLNLSLSQIQDDIYLPNAFSPNGDNINDVFLPVFNCDQVDYYNLQIFDRWGNLLFESENKYRGWNGKNKDVNMNPGVYPYVIQYELHGSERKVKAGEITLIR